MANTISPNLVIAEVADVTLEDLVTGKVIMTATAQTTSISQTIDEQEIRGGIGGGLLATIQSQKTIEAQLTDALFSLDYIELVQGSGIEEGKKTLIWLNGEAEVTATDELTLDDLSFNGRGRLTVGGIQHKIDFISGVSDISLATISPSLTIGDKVKVLLEKEVEGQKVAIRTDTFPNKYKMTFRTVALNQKTGEHEFDVIVQFDEVQPAGNFDLGFEMSTPMTPEVSFKVTKSGNCNEIGRFMLVEPNKDEVDC